MSLGAAIAEGRAAAEARMTSTCTIYRATDGGIQDEWNGVKGKSWSTIYAGLRCRIAGGHSDSATRTASHSASDGVEYQLSSRLLHLPVTTTDLRDNDFIKVTDGECAGLVFRIIEADWADQTTARRVPVRAVARPEEWS